MSSVYHGTDVTTPARLIPLASIQKRHSKFANFKVRVEGPVELADGGEYEITFDVWCHCEINVSDGCIDKLSDFQEHELVEIASARFGKTPVNLNRTDAENLFAEFYAVTKTVGDKVTFPNREHLLALCRAKNNE